MAVGRHEPSLWFLSISKTNTGNFLHEKDRVVPPFIAVSSSVALGQDPTYHLRCWAVATHIYCVKRWTVPTGGEKIC